MDKSLFGFIWKYSRRQQIVLLAATISLFPLLYLTLELPKRIINDAIGAETSPVDVFGVRIDQITFLFILCGLFLFTVTVHGLLKMRVNTMKGVMAERLLRTLRYTMIERVLRFPPDVLDRMSEGELVSMITSETEPMGGLMGDAIAQPVLQAGQMFTILLFLFSQSFAFGFAAVAFIPLQAWLIPRLQKRVNRLNKKRMIEVRALAGEIGTNAGGTPTLRTNGGWGFRMGLISDRLATLLDVRFDIYKKKFFMKFVNNFISQLTPFFFYAVGGYLVIRGEVSIGALVAALAAFKDLSGPWKELLAYYNVSQDMSQRWELLTERFTPDGMVSDALFDGDTDGSADLTGDVTLDAVDLRNAAGDLILSESSFTFAAGTSTLVVAPAEEDRRALADLLQRERRPVFGTVSLAGHDLGGLHQKTIVRRIGMANSRPMVFDGTYLENLLLPLLRTDAHAVTGNPALREAMLREDAERLRVWWGELIGGLHIAGALFERGLSLTLSERTDTPLAQELPGLRHKVKARLEAVRLDGNVRFFHADAYNPALTVGENILFAIARGTMTAERVAVQTRFLDLLADLKIDTALFDFALSVADTLLEIFGADGDSHPLFRKLDLEAVTYRHVTGLLKRDTTPGTLTKDDKAHLLAVLFAISSEKLGIAFEPEIVDRVLDIRRAHAERLRDSLGGQFTILDADRPIPGLTVYENAVFGMIVTRTPTEDQALKVLIGKVLEEFGCRAHVLNQILDLVIQRGGGNLPAMLGEALSMCRATVKQPDLLILDEPLASFGAAVRRELPARLRALLPTATMIFLQAHETTGAFDRRVTLQRGKLVADARAAAPEEDGNTVKAEIARKLRALEGATLFRDLERKQQRLLAFGSRWYRAEAGDYIFHQNDPPDSGVFLIVEGTADLLRPQTDGADTLVATVGPGTLVGELGLIRQEPRALDMRAAGDLLCLNITEDAFMAVVQNDAATSFRLLQVIAGYV